MSTADAAGEFTIEVPVGSGYRLTASAPEYLTAVRTNVAVQAALDTPLGNVILSGRDVTYDQIIDFEEKTVGSTDVAPLAAAQVNGTVLVTAQGDNQFARLSRTSGTGSSAPATSLTYTAGTPLSGVITIEQKVRRPLGQPSAQFFGAPYVRNSSGQNLISIGWSGGKVSAYNGATYLAQIGTYTDAWVTVRLVVDTNAQTYSAYLDGQEVLQNAGLRNPIGSGIAVVANYADGPNRGTTDIDDFRIAHGVGYSAAETSLASLESTAGELEEVDATTYRLTAGADDESTTITASALSPFARSVTVDGQDARDGVEVALDGSPIIVVVTAEDGTVVEYTVEVRKPTTLVDDAAAVAAGENVTVDVLANDGSTPALSTSTLTLLDGDGNTAQSVATSFGTFTLAAGKVRFTSNSAAPSGNATTTYRVSNETGAAATATLTVAVTAKPTEPQVAPWSASTVYLAGDEVSYGGTVFVAQWWTQNQQPTASVYGPWAERGTTVACASGPVTRWTNSWVYTGGETVFFNGQRWKAKWWTRNQTPGDQWGPWETIGTC